MELSINADVKPHAEDKCVSNKDFSCRGEADVHSVLSPKPVVMICVSGTQILLAAFSVGCAM